MVKNRREKKEKSGHIKMSHIEIDIIIQYII